jgi:cystine transport system substrate-binding protein
MLSLMSCSQSHNDRLAQAHASGTIRIGITGTSPPWTTFDANHQPAGYDVAVAKEIARRLGIAHPVFVPDAFKSLVEGLKADKYDLVLNDLTPTPAREQQLDFAQPYGVEDFRIFVAKENATIHGTADLKGARVGVTTGTSNESWARAHLPGADIRGYDNGSLIFRDLALGRLDVVIISHFGGLKYAHANQQPVKEVGPPLTFQLSAPAMAKGQDHLKSAVNAAIADMTRSGAIDRLAAEWVGVNYVMSAAIGQGKQEAAADVRAAPSPETSSGLHDLISRSLPLLGPALLTTISLGFTAFILGSVLGLLIALARLSKLRPLRWLGLAYVSVFRGTPLLVQILLIYFGLPQLGLKLGPLPAAILALTQFSAAYLSENFRAGIMAVDKGQWEAATSMGMGYWMTLWRVVLPQGFRIALPSIGSRLIALMKDTSLASVITVVELTRVADEVGATTFRYVEAFTMVGLIYWFLNQILTLVQLGIETRLSRHLR